MIVRREEYFSALTAGGILDSKYVEALFEAMEARLTLEAVPPELLERGGDQHKITEKLSRLPLRVARARRSWGGLVVGFPGGSTQLTTEALGTPYLREILYPILDLHGRIGDYYGERLPCLYLLGVRFPDVVLTKFSLLEPVIRHIVVLTHDLLHRPGPEAFPSRIDEHWVQVWLCRQMMSTEGLRVPTEDGNIDVGNLTHELSTGEGTMKRERLDILGVDLGDRSLVAFEIKGPDCGRVQLENLFLQGLAHREWLEGNKMAIKFMLDGPRGRQINTRKRVRLLLGFFQEEVPELFWDLRQEAMRDPQLKIDLVSFSHEGGLDGKLVLTSAQSVVQ
jgi:hypothetical protein